VLPQALEHLLAHGPVTVRIHPCDLDQAQDLQQDGRALSKPGSIVQLQADENVRRGGCVIESAFGTIDARLDAQLAELEQRFREQISRAGSAV
jgi:flagellar assembly protein FliH